MKNNLNKVKKEGVQQKITRRLFKSYHAKLIE